MASSQKQLNGGDSVTMIIENDAISGLFVIRWSNWAK